MADDKENDYQKLPTEDKCVHKIWKARLQGYEEALSTFNKIDDAKSPQWNKYLGLIKKFVTDSNAVAQEKGMEAALVFVENCGIAGKTTGEVMNGIIAKCIAAPKTKTKDLALQITLMYIEIEKQDTVQEELIKGMDAKNPKIVSACVSACTQALKQFGNKVFAIKPLVPKIAVILTDRDKTVRDEGKALVVEMYRWIGPNIEAHIQSLPQLLKQELKDAFASIGVGVARPTRYLKSQQKKAENARMEEGDSDYVVEGADAGPDPAELDPYDMMSPVEIISKIPKDFYEKLEAKKWQDRKEALDSLENVLKNAHRLEGGDYADLVRALKKIISKDTNVMLVAEAGRLLAKIASGLRNKFSPYAVACTSAILEKFKERKTNVVTALREAIDAIYPCTNLEAILEDINEAFNNKNPAVKAEAALFLVRNWCKTQPTALTKKMLNAYTDGLLKLLESADPNVRDAAAEALGVAMKLVGEKAVMPYIDKIDKLKIQKIKEFCDKATIEVKIPGRKKEARPATESAARAGSAQPKPVKRPGTGARKPVPGLKKSSSSMKANTRPQPVREPELSPEDVDEMAEPLFGTQVMNGMADSNWKTRLSSVQTFASTVQGLSPDAATSQFLFKAINKKPGLKETNFQVLKIKLDLVKTIAETFPLTITAVESILEDVVEKLGDAKCSSSASDALTALAEHHQLEPIVCLSLEYALDKQKNPKVQAELFGWLTVALKEFGFNINITPLITHSKKAVSATNPAVRVAAISFLGVLSLYAGPSIIEHFDGEKAALKQQISLELDKYANDSPPPPTRGVKKSASKASVLDTEEEDSPMPDAELDNDTTPEPTGPSGATDISAQITDVLINELNDKNWKVRNDALEKVKSIISTSAPVKPALGELPNALAARLVDSNSKLAQTALSICQELGPALGTKCKQHAKIFLPNLFQAMGDSKALNRSGALQCVEAWTNAAGSCSIALQDEILLDALKRASPAGRQEIFGWLGDSLPQVSAKSFAKEELVVCVPMLYASLEDRNSDVRKRANDCVLGFMLHLGYDSMHRQMEKLKPASKAVVLAALDKARPNLPIQPLPTTASNKSGSKAVKSGGAQKKEAAAEKKVGKAKPIVKTTARPKKEEEESGSLLPQNNHKNQRIIDDQKLKVLKWNFTVPREEFFELLKDQMTVAGVSRALVGNMFHADFRYHLKALESLTEDLSENGDALICNLDLILKWLTLRFFDTNPSVILKGLEYLQLVFTYLISVDYTMAEYEAGCFIPYLVLKVGDPKDSVRNGVKALFKQICVVYSVTKLFGYLMEGLKSKNARQRAECLDSICHLMECYGSSVMSPSPASACKELARHIADRDNGVRSAALNAITCAYFLEGERVYKMIGQISDKDMSLLEERIKRAEKSRSAENRKSKLLPLTPGGKQLVTHLSQNNLNEDKSPSVEPEIPVINDVEVKEPTPAISQLTVTKQPREADLITGPFGLDPHVMEKLDSAHARLKSIVINEIDTSFLDEPIKRPTTAGLQSPIVSRVAPTLKLQDTSDDALVADTIHSIGSPDLKVAVRAITVLHDCINEDRGQMLGARGEEQLLRAAAAQLRLLGARTPSPEIFSAHRGLIALVSDFYERGMGCSAMASSAAAGALLPELLHLMCTECIHEVQTGSDYSKLKRILNSVCVKLLENADKTTLVCTMIGSLKDAIAGENSVAHARYRELLMKCFWKVLKAMQTWDVTVLDYDSVLYKVHLFNKEYPNNYWKRQSNIPDTPYRTIKTLVHALTKIKGPGILQHLSQLPADAELCVYIHRLLRVLEEKKENINTDSEAPAPSKLSVPEVIVTLHNQNVNNAISEELAHILRKISEKEHAAEAMMQLYLLKERNPSVDIWSFMQDSSVFLRNYIEKGLKDIAEKKKYMPVTLPLNTVPLDVSNDNVADQALVNYYTDKLKKLRVRAGLPESDNLSRSPVSDNRTSYIDSINENTRTNNYDPHLEFHPTQTLQQRNEGEVDAIRQRLQQIKSKR